MATKLTNVVADFITALSAKVSATDTTATLQSATDSDSVALPTGQYSLTIDGDNSDKEYIVCTLTSTALTNVKNVTRQGVQSDGFAKEHRVGASVEITNFSNLRYIKELLDGTTDLDASTPLKYDGTASILNDEDLATKKYIDDIAIAGGADASTTVKGITKLSTAPASATNPIAVGDNDTRIPTQDENNALVGTSGTAVSSSNKLVDDDDTAVTATADKVVRADGSGKIDDDYLNISDINATTLTDGSDADSLHIHPKYIPEQDIPYYVGTTTTASSGSLFQTNSDGSVGALYYVASAGTEYLLRLERDTITGQYVITHNVAVTSGIELFDPLLCVGSSYVYIGYTDSAARKFKRYDIADLTNETDITVSGTLWNSGKAGFSDGTNLYAYTTTDTIFKYTVSGTTATYDSSITLTDAGALQYRGLTCDGTNIFTTNDENGEIVINKYALTGGAIISTVTRYVYPDAYEDDSPIKLYPSTDDALGLAFSYSNYDEAGMIGSTIHLMAITKP